MNKNVAGFVLIVGACQYCSNTGNQTSIMENNVGFGPFLDVLGRKTTYQALKHKNGSHHAEIASSLHEIPPNCSNDGCCMNDFSCAVIA